MMQRIQDAKQSWSLVRRVFLFAMGVCAVLATRAEATLVPLIGLDQMIAEAELIVEGKVVDVTSRWSENRTTIYTYVTLGDLLDVHGQVAGDTLTLRFEGGEVDGFRVAVHGTPSFDLGEREFLFVRGNNVAVSPIVGFFQGRFKVINEEIHDNDGIPIVEIRGNTFIKVSNQPEQTTTSADMTAGTPDNRRYSYREGADEEPTAPQKDVLPPQASEGSKEPDTSRAGRVAPPPPSTQEQVPPTQELALPPTPEQVVVYLDPQRDTGKRLSTEEFIRIIRTRLNP